HDRANNAPNESGCGFCAWLFIPSGNLAASPRASDAPPRTSLIGQHCENMSRQQIEVGALSVDVTVGELTFPKHFLRQRQTITGVDQAPAAGCIFGLRRTV